MLDMLDRSDGDPWPEAPYIFEHGS